MLSSRKLLVLSTLLASTILPAIAYAQQQPLPSQPPLDEEPENIDVPVEGEVPLDEQEIVITGTRVRGQVVGDIPPEVQLSERDIGTYGAGTIAELLDALAPLTQSGRGRGGGRPVVLLNGQRISGFSEIRNLPPEAIERVDILPEEVALKYGYRADQRVVNFVLKANFAAITTELDGGFATDGGRTSYGAEANILRIDQNGRWNLEAEYQHQTPLFESEREIVQANPDPLLDVGDYRTLLAETDEASLAGTLNRTILGDVAATVNARLDASSSETFIGIAPAGSEALTRTNDARSAHLGFVLNGDLSPWRWSLTGNFDRGSNETLVETGARPEEARTFTQVATAEFVANGTLFALPAGDVSTSFRLGAGHQGLRSESDRNDIEQTRELSRRNVNVQANVDLPIASRRRDVLGAVGDLSANLNVEVEHLSDFGSLRTLGGGINWSPVEQVRVIASVTDEDGAPSMQQLGDPTVLNPNTRVFDFLTGETVDVARLEGGNPGLLADNRRVYKIGLTLRPLEETDLTLRADYNQSRIRNPIASFPTATPEIEAAFPDRFIRDAGGRLLQIDSRPVNFARSERKELRWGINFSTDIGAEAPRQGAAGRGPGGDGAATEGGRGPGVGRPARAGGGWRPGSRGDDGAGRLQLGLFHTWAFKDEILIRPELPVLDLLDGSATGSRGGQPRHQVELQAGLTKDGIGARLDTRWQSGTFVRGVADGSGGTTGDLDFGSFTTTNLRIFANLDQRPALIARYPWLKATRISLSVNNLFNNRLDVTDAAGGTPINYQPNLLDPLGRFVRLSIRKQF